MELRGVAEAEKAAWQDVGLCFVLVLVLACSFVGILLIIFPPSSADANGRAGAQTITPVAGLTETPTRTDVPQSTDAVIPSATP